jgi:hypothetical protein
MRACSNTSEKMIYLYSLPCPLLFWKVVVTLRFLYLIIFYRISYFANSIILKGLKTFPFPRKFYFSCNTAEHLLHLKPCQMPYLSINNSSIHMHEQLHYFARNLFNFNSCPQIMQKLIHANLFLRYNFNLKRMTT